MIKVCMIVPNRMVKGGIAAVVDGYYQSDLEQKYQIKYVESYMDGNKIQKLLKAISGYLIFLKVLIFEKPDIVHIHSSFGPSFYRKMPFIYMASWANKKIINHIHGADFNNFYTNATEKKKRQIAKVYARCDKLIALSEEWKERLAKIVPQQKIVVIENYSILREDILEERCHRKSNHKVLFLGEIGKRKGCFDIPEVIKKVVEKIPDVTFILAGAGKSSDEEQIRNLLKEAGVLNHVIFPGWVRGKKKEKLLREADVFFLPSYNEGMPMSVLDAMGYGLPVVSTNVGGIPKLVKNGENGICCDPGDIEKMQEGISTLLEEKRIEASKSSFEIVREQYSLEVHLKKLESCYEACIHQRRKK